MESGSPPLRFVVLRHEGVAPPHYDIMFESAPGEALWTWRSEVWPLAEGAELVRQADHRRLYLDYEGLVSGNRGSVTRFAEGECRCPPPHTDPTTGWTHWPIVLNIPNGPQRRLDLWQRPDGTWRGRTSTG